MAQLRLDKRSRKVSINLKKVKDNHENEFYERMPSLFAQMRLDIKKLEKALKK